MQYSNGHRNGSAPATIAPPALYNVDAEEAVIGSILIDPDTFWTVADRLKAGDFHNLITRAVYSELAEMAVSRAPIGVDTVERRLRDKATPPADGWLPWLIRVLNVVGSSFHIAEYARVVEQYAVRRLLLVAADQAATLAYRVETPIDDALSAAERTLFEVRQGRADSGLQSIGVLAMAALDDIEKRRTRAGQPAGVLSGFYDLDRLLSGFIAPFPYIIAARPGMGKSAFVGNIAAYAAKHGQRVLFCAVEMTARQVINRMISAETGIPLGNIRDGRLDNGEMTRITEAAGRISEWPLIIDDTPGLTPGQVRARAMRASAEHRLDLVIVDHLHEMNADQPRNQRHLELGDMVRHLKETGKLIHAPMLIVAQLSRSLESRSSKRPQLADLRESGAIEEVGYAVLFIHRENYFDDSKPDNVAEVIVCKNRDGDLRTVSLYWDAKRTAFGNLQRERINL